MFDVTPAGHFPHSLSLASASLLCIGFAWLFVRALRSIAGHRRRARAADGAVDAEAELVAGTVLVAGVVELDDAPFAARIEIEQRGSERNRKGSISHEWRETRRRTFAHPFWIRHATGERVFVPVAKNIRLVTKLDRQVHDETLTRYRIAELNVGETVVATGRLEQKRVGRPAGQGYRDGIELVWTLTPDGAEPLDLSAERLGDKHKRRARSLTKLLVLGWLPCIVVSGLCLLPFFVRTLTGAPVEGVVTGLKEEATRDSDQRVHLEWHVDYETSAGQGHDLITGPDWRTLSVGDPIAVFSTPGLEDVLGQDATLYSVWLLIPTLVFAVLFLFMSATKPDWFDAPVIDRGGGHLKKPEPSAERVLSRGA
ncbi:MAG: hypothetical protein AB8H86_33625 [Polyangiales bacterium]